MASESIPASNPSSSNSAILKSGVRQSKIQAGETVGNLRNEWSGLYKIASDSKPMVNGKEVGEDYVIQPGDSLEYVKKTGEKG